MKTTKRLLTLLLVLALMLSLAITVSAQENEDHAPYLSIRDLWNDGEGWYESEEAELRWGEDGTTALDWSWRVYYLNIWDEDAGEYVSQPVIPSENHPNLTVTLVSEDPNEGYICEGEENADYFVKVTALNSMDYQETELYYMYNGQKISLPFYIYERWSGFYTSQKVSTDTAILNGNFETDAMADENAFYYIVHSDYWKVDSIEYTVTQWDENGNETVNNALVEMTEIENGIHKFTVNPDFVRMVTGDWQNFNLRVRLELSGEEGDTNVDERDVWVQPGGNHDNAAAFLNINGLEYMFYEDSDVIGTWEPQFDENGDPLINGNGDHTHYWTKAELPEGVSYDVDTNTLTLNNAHLETLSVSYHWVNRDENNEIVIREDGTPDEGWNLPNGNFKLKLQGSNEIVCDYGSPVEFREEVDVTINGTGSLLVKAINSQTNTRIEYYKNAEKEVYHHFDALRVNDGCSLTIAGNAKVTAEIEGEAYETIWDDNGPTDRYENAYLSAVRVDEGNLTLKDNAALTTVLPDYARDNGPAIDGYYSGGYRGVENVRTLNIRDKATLTTSSLHVPNGWQWNEETQQDEVTWTGTYNQTGGTVTITGLGSYGVNMNDEGELIPHFHYNGIWTDFGEINISGGTLNVSAEPTDDEAAVSAWAQAIGVGEGALNISGGTVNADVSYGRAINADSGDVTVSGGTVNLNPYDGYGIATGDWEADPDNGYNPDGTLLIKGGVVNISCEDSGYPTPAIELLATTKSFVISGGELNIENGMFDIYATLDIRGGKVELNATTSQNYFAAFGPVNTDAAVNMSGGELIIDTTNYMFGVISSGIFRQTGGDVTVNAAAEDAWRAEHTETDEDGTVTREPYVYGFVSAGDTILSGGTMTVNGADCGFHHEFAMNPELDDNGNVIPNVLEDYKLEISGDMKLDVTGAEVGFDLFGVAEIKGGSVNAVATGDGKASFGLGAGSTAGEYNYRTEDGDIITYEMGNIASLSITGGSHSFTAPSNFAGDSGMFLLGCPTTIENATVAVTGGRGLFEVTEGQESIVSGTFYIISRKNGEALEKFQYDDGTASIYYYAEDNQSADGELEDAVLASEILILPDNKCGDEAYWEIKDGVLTISGKGEMYDYNWADFALGLSTAPWNAVKHAITEVVVEEGITYVGAWSFAWLENVTKISYPASMTALGEASVVQTKKLAAYKVASGNKRYASPDGISLVDLKESRLHTVAIAAPGKTYTVPDGVTVIGGAALQLCGFEEVIIPEGVTEIQVAAFEGCANLKTVTIPMSVKTMGDAVFVGCDKVTVKVYCETAGETYVEENGIKCEIIHEYSDSDPDTCIRCEKPEEVEKPDVSDCSKDASCALSKYVDLVATDWYHDGIHYCIDEGLMNGMSANTFEAGGFTTRAQLVTILYRAAKEPDISGLTEPFADVAETDWFYKAVVWAYNNNVVNGVSADSFAPNANVTREQVATILYRYTGSPAVSGSLAGFPDKANVSSYAETPLLWATGEGLINGVMQPDGTSLLDPTGNATRAQIATILMRYLTNG